MKTPIYSKNAKDVRALIKVKGARKLYGHAAGFHWELGKIGSGHFLDVPPIEEFTFDVSVPRLLEWAFNPHNLDHLIAAAVHDLLLKEKYDAAVASAEFRRVLRGRGVSAQSGWSAFFATLWHTELK